MADRLRGLPERITCQHCGSDFKPRESKSEGRVDHPTNVGANPGWSATCPNCGKVNEGPLETP